MFHRTCIQVIALAWIVVPLWAAQRGKVEFERPFRDNVTLPIDSNLRKRFETAKDLLSDKRWNEAISLLQEIAQTEGTSLVNVDPGKVGGVATYVNVANHCNLLLSRASAEGREVYRQKLDPQSRRWFENWQRTRDEAELLRIVRHAYLSRHGDDALLALGESAWDRGDFSAARLWWGQLIPLPENANPADYPTVLRYPDADIDLALVLARIILCSIEEAEFERAEDELQQLATRFPLAEGWICGKQGRLVEIVTLNLFESRHWKRVPPAAEVSTFGLSPERYARIPETLDVGALRWSRPLPPNMLQPSPERLPYINEPLSYHPVVYNKIVLVNDFDAIRAWNILTGEPAWQSERRDPSVIYPSVPDEVTLAPDKPCVGAPHYTMTIANGLLYARMGSPVTCSSTSELRREFASDLVCLDLNQEGKTVWKFAAHELFRDEPPWRFEGSPVILGGRAYVALCRRHPQLELMVACLDASDGRLLWQRNIGAFRSSVDESHNRVTHLLLTAGGGRLFLSTDAGVIVAMDAVDGRMEWAISYESRPDDVAPAFNDPSRKGLLPAMFHEGLLFVAPSDATAAYCIEADSGRIRWQHKYIGRVQRDREAPRLRSKQWRQLLGVVRGGTSGRLIVSGNGLTAIDVETGDVVWERGEGTVIHAGEGAYGRGLIAGNQIFLPLRESIQIFNAGTGQQLRQVLLKTPDSPQTGGNLTLAGGMLLVAQPNRLAAYCEYSRLKQRIEFELTENPDDSLLRIQLAELEAAEGHVELALSVYRNFLERIDREDPDYFRVRRKLSKLLQDAGSAESAHQQPAAARDRWIEALDFTDDITKQVDLIFSLASADEALDKPEDALRRLQEILNNERLASVRRESLTSGQVATETMSRVISKYGREAYSQIESEAAVEIERLAMADDRHGLKGFIARYPHASVSGKARSLLIQLHHTAGEVSEAYAAICETERDVTNDRTLVEMTLSKIELMQQARLTDSAVRMWRKLLARPSMEIEFAGKNADLHELARQQLKKYGSIRPVQPSFLQRTWSSPLAAETVVVVPQFEAPSAEFKSLLMCSKHPKESSLFVWRCFDWRTGQMRWEETAASPIRIAAWTDVHLLIGTPNGWQARSPDTGRRVWEQVSNAECTALIANEPSSCLAHEGPTATTLFPALFDVDRGLQLFDGNDGQTIANVKPVGRLQPMLGIGSVKKNLTIPGESVSPSSSSKDRPMIVAMQTVKPTRTWFATAASPRGKWTMNEVSDGGQPWQATPLLLDNEAVALTTDLHLVGFGVSQDQQNLAGPDSNNNGTLRVTNRWSYNNFATGMGPPAAFSCRDQLLVAVDGSRLESFDPTAGKRKWSTGLADYPLKSPLRQICAVAGSVYATSQGTLRAISVVDGKVAFERYLGDVALQWRTTVAWIARTDDHATESRFRNRRKALIAAWPLEHSDTNRCTIRVCDAETGAISQQISMDGQPREFFIDPDGFGIVWTLDRITGLRFASTTAVADAGRKQ